MTRLGLAATALSGLVAGVVGAETTVRLSPFAPDALAFAGIAGGGLLVGMLALALRHPRLRAARPRTVARAATRPARTARKRVMTLIRDGAAPDRIARDTGLPLDVVMMAVRADRTDGAFVPPAATVAEPLVDVERSGWTAAFKVLRGKELRFQ